MSISVKFYTKENDTLVPYTDIDTEDGYFSLPDDPSRDGYEFKGWYKDSSGNEKFDSNADMPVTEDTVLYGLWEALSYTVTFLTFDLSVGQILYVTHGDTVSGVEEPVEEGYTFIGWYTDQSFTERFILSTPITSNMEIYPKFEAKVLNLWFDCGDDGPTVPTQKIPYGETGDYPDEPDYYGHEFIGWYKDYLYKNLFDFGAPIKEDTTVYGKFEVIYVTVNYVDEDDNEIYPSKTLPYGTILSRPKDPTKEGKTFSHWTYQGIKYTFTEKLESSITLTAVFTDVQCIVTYELNGGTSLETSQMVVYGETAEIPEEPEKEGNTFVTWCTSSSLTEVYNFDSPVTQNITIYAKWKVETFTVSYMVDGDLYDVRTVEWRHRAPSNVVSPSKDTYQFVGWYDESDNLFDFTKEIKEDTHIYAKFSKQQTTVLFNTTGGSVIAPVIINLGESVNEPVAPTRDGYTFVGWYEDTQLSVEYDFDSLVMHATVIYAKWEIDIYEVTINTNDNDENVYEYEVKYGDTVKQPQNPVLSGYSFIEWRTEDGKPYDFSTPITGDIVIEAAYREYVSETTEDFLAMINSGNYYKADDIGNAIQAFIDSYVEDNSISGWRTEDLKQLYSYAAQLRSSFTGDTYYLLEYEYPNFKYTEKQITYSIPLSTFQLNIAIPVLYGLSGPTVEQRKELGNYLNSYFQQIKDGNYDPL